MENNTKIRSMSDDEIKKALQDILDQLDADPEDNPDEPAPNMDELEEKSKNLISELERRNAENAAATARQEQRQKLLDAVKRDGKIINERKDKNEMTEKRTYGPETEEYRVAYLKGLQGKELTQEERAAVDANKSVIPTITVNKVIGVMQSSPIMDAIDVSHIIGGVTYPVETTCGDANWVAMGTAATDSEDAYGEITLAAYKLIKTIEINADVSKMAISAFETWISEKLGNKILKACDKSVFTGTGVGQASGILKAGTISNVGTFTKAHMTYKDLLKIMAALPTEYATNACFAMNRAMFYGEVLGIENTAGDKVVVADAQAPAKLNIMGFKVIVDDNCSADTVIFGDFSAYKFNFAADPQITSDNSTAFRTGSTVYRAMALADGKVGDPNAFTVFTRATA